VAPNRGKDLPPKCNSIALYGAAFPFLLFLFCLIYWHLAFFVLNRLAPCLFFFSGYFPFGAKLSKMWQRGRGARKENCGRERACTREGEDRERACTREGEDGEEGGVVVVDRNDDENNGDKHKVTSNY